MRQEFLIDALSEYEVEPDDPQRSVPNPARKAVDKELGKARAKWNKLKQAYGERSRLTTSKAGLPRSVRSKKADKKIYREIQEAAEHVAELAAKQKSLESRVPLAEARPNQDLVKLATERQHLTNVLKLVAYQIESDLVNLIALHYARAEDEGRTLIQTVLQSSATLQPTEKELRVSRRPSVPHIDPRQWRPCARTSTQRGPAFQERIIACILRLQAIPNDRSGQISRGVCQEF